MTTAVDHGNHPTHTLREIALAYLHESPLNPRRHFDDAALTELAESIRKAGILTPLIVRPSGKHRYEIAAGHRRLRASKMAALESVPCIIREMDDQTFLEILTVENLQREDVHPLDEAKGYEALMAAPYRMDVQRIAEKVGRSVRYIFDRVKLLELSPEAQDLFWGGYITAGHAVILARLSPSEQARVIGTASQGYDDGGLFQNDHGLYPPDDVHGEPDHPLHGLKAVSVLELQSFINARVRFDPKKAEPILFPETVETVTKAIEEKRPLISITHDYHVRPEAKDGTRTYGPMSWKRADGEQGSKPCSHAVMGAVVVGPGRGEAFDVCIAKKECLVHWKDDARAAQAKAKNGAESPAAKAAEAKAATARKAEEEKRQRQEERRAHWKVMRPKIQAAVMARVKELPTDANGVLADLLIARVSGYGQRPKPSIVRGKSAEDLIRHAAAIVLLREINDWSAHEEFPKLAKTLGVDLSPFVKLDKDKAKKGKGA